MPNRVFGHTAAPLILVVDDAPEQRLIIERFLAVEGYRVATAGGGLMGLKMYGELQPDLVILDLRMPDIDGITVCRRIKQQPGGVETPIFMLTAAFEEEAVDQAYAAGITDYITKPVSLSVLRQRVRQTLQAQESSRLAQLLMRGIAATTSGLSITDARIADNPIVYVNPAFEHLTGYTAAEVMGRNCRFLQGASTDPAMVQAIRDGIRGQEATRVELVNYRKDGTPFWNELSISPIYDEIGRLTHFVGVQNDITERRRVQDALRHAKLEWETTVDTVAELIFLTNPAGKIVRCNRTAAVRLGKDIRKLVGKAIQPLLFAQNEISPNFQSGEAETVYLASLEAWCTVTRYDLRREGNTYGVVYSLTDITHRLQAERQVAQAERLAALGRLAAVLAHEINNPLQAIQIQLDLVMDYPLSAEDRERYLERTRKEISRLSEMTQRVLNFARPARQPRHASSISDLIRQTLALVNKQIQVSKLKLTSDVADVAPIVVAPDQMTQVFLNLILNAIEATPAGGQIQVSVRDEHHGVTVEFMNEGPPIASHHLPHIFDPFFTTKEQGGGMGLSISHSIVTDHKGTLSAENLPYGSGVCFTVWLPRHSL
jgi:PAS domain S-box-containing protein